MTLEQIKSYIAILCKPCHPKQIRIAEKRLFDVFGKYLIACDRQNSYLWLIFEIPGYGTKHLGYDLSTKELID